MDWFSFRWLLLAGVFLDKTRVTIPPIITQNGDDSILFITRNRPENTARRHTAIFSVEGWLMVFSLKKQTVNDMEIITRLYKTVWQISSVISFILSPNDTVHGRQLAAGGKA